MHEIIGLDIGSHSMKLVGLKMTSKGPFLACIGMRELPPNQEKEDIHAFSEILKTLVEEVHLKTKKVNLVVSGTEIQIKRLSIPSLPKSELKEAVRWEIKNSLPFPAETAQINFHILNEYIEDHVKKLDLLAVACPKPLIDRTLSIAIGAGLKPVHLNIGPFALWNALLTWDQRKIGKIIGLIDLGAEKTGIYIFKDDMIQFSREVTPAGVDLTKAIMEGITSEKDPSLLFERAEGIKREMGVPLESPQTSKMIFLIRPVFEKLVAEIGRSLEYYKSLFNEEKIDKLILTGGGAHIKNISTYLSNELHLPVESLNPLEEILFDPKQVDIQTLRQRGSIFTLAIGIAIPQPRRIELLPSKEPLFSKAKVAKSLPLLIPGVVLLIFLAIIGYMNEQVRTLQKERDEKIDRAKGLDDLQERLRILKEKEMKIKENLSLFPSAMRDSIPYQDILREISNLLPDNVTLTLLSIRYKTKSLKEEIPLEEGKDFHLSGLVFGTDRNCLTSLALIIERLEKSSFFKNVRLISTDENRLYNRNGAEFNIVCDINPVVQRKERN